MAQVHPVVSRLCGSIEGTDAARIADCLGLDPSRFSARGSGGGGAGSEDARDEALISGASFFDDPARFKVRRAPPPPPATLTHVRAHALPCDPAAGYVSYQYLPMCWPAVRASGPWRRLIDLEEVAPPPPTFP